MTDEQVALGRRVVACKGWRWMPGMLAHFEHDGRRVRVGMPDAWASTTALPDLTDPATLGCLLALVREAWEEKVVIRIGTGWWEIEAERFLSDDTCAVSLAESLVAALEAAP
jgi:hypothetical protein